MIEVTNLTRKYNVYEKETGFLLKKEKKEINALCNISFKVKDGNNIGILGMNGAGKSTLIKLMCGIISPSSGNIKIDSFDPFEKNREYLKNISLVSGNKTQLNYDLSAKDNFYYLGAIYDLKRIYVDEKVRQLSNALGCPHLIDRQIRKMSFGERLKMEIISSLLHNPKYIFMDEPTIGLDVKTQYQLRNFLQSYNDGTKTIFITSHNLEDISEVCNSILVIDQGILSYFGKLDKFCESYNVSQKLEIKVKENILNEIIFYLNTQKFISNILHQTTTITFDVVQTEFLSILKELLNKFSKNIIFLDINTTKNDQILKKRLLEN